MRQLLIVGVSLACLSIVGPASVRAQKKDTASARPGYDLRMILVGNTFQAIRFKPATGETWQAHGTKWKKIPETGPVPPGDYDIRLVATDQDFSAMRLERTTGATWLLKNREWVKLDEPDDGK